MSDYIPSVADKHTPALIASILENYMSPRFVFFVRSYVLRTGKMPDYTKLKIQVPYIFRDSLDHFARALLATSQLSLRAKRWEELQAKHKNRMKVVRRAVDKSR
jgi:hypothetical protein